MYPFGRTQFLFFGSTSKSGELQLKKKKNLPSTVKFGFLAQTDTLAGFATQSEKSLEWIYAVPSFNGRENANVITAQLLS